MQGALRSAVEGGGGAGGLSPPSLQFQGGLSPPPTFYKQYIPQLKGLFYKGYISKYKGIL